MASWSDVRGDSNRIRLAAAAALGEGTRNLTNVLSRVQIAKALKQQQDEERTLRAAAFKVKTEEARGASESYLAGLKGENPEAVFQRLGPLFRPGDFDRGSSEARQVADAKRAFDKAQADAALMETLGPLLETARTKGPEAVSGQDYLKDPVRFDAMYRLYRDKQKVDQEKADESKRLGLMAKYHKDPKSLTDEEWAFIAESIHKEESLNLRKKVEEGVAERAKMAEAAAKRRLDLATLKYKLALKSEDRQERASLFDDAMAAIKESQDEFTNRRGTFNREEWVQSSPENFGLAQLEVELKKGIVKDYRAGAKSLTQEGGKTPAPADTEARIQDLESRIDTLSKDELEEYLRLTGE